MITSSVPAQRVDTTSPVDLGPLVDWVRAAALDPPVDACSASEEISRASTPGGKRT